MATTTGDTPVAQTTSAAPVAAVRSRLADRVLLGQVFVGGASVMLVEMSASRLLAPYFGTSLFIWANLIGLVMIYLALGYWLGGRLADRYPRHAVLYGITAAAGLAVGLIPVLSRPILTLSLTGFDTYSVGIFYGSLIGVIILFSVPLVLLGFVSPFAIRLRSLDVSRAGGTAGGVSALSTLGSILGTFIPVFILIPRIGTAATLYTAAVLLLVFSIFGLLAQGSVRPAVVYGAMLAAVVALALFAPRGLVREPAPGKELLYERESPYNYIQVVRQGTRVSLVLNEGHATHSVYDPNALLTGGPWDYWLIAPYFSKYFSPGDLESMAMIGSAAGTAAHQYSVVYPDVHVDSVEIDGDIVEAGKRFFALGSLTNNTNYVQDGRTFLKTDGRDKKWTVVGIDAYHQPYIPFHLTTREFFQEVSDHLTEDGAAMINAGRTATDLRLVDALANTMLQVFPNVYVIDTPSRSNSMVIGTKSPTRVENFAENAARVTDPVLKQVFAAALDRGNIREVKPNPEVIVFTDDRAPVEEVINQMILGVVSGAAE